MKPLYLFAAITVLNACGTSFPTVETPGLTKPKIGLLFQFPEGSVCRVNTSVGLIEMKTIPGAIDFPAADRNAPSSCTLPSGKTVRVTAHNFVPKNTTVAGITVYPDGNAFITASTSDGDLVSLQPTGTVR